MIMARLKRWAIAAGGLLIAGLYFALRILRLKAQRDQALTEAQQEKGKRAAVESTRAREQDLQQAQQGAREKAAAVQQDAEQQRQEGRRPKSFRDPRLRGKP